MLSNNDGCAIARSNDGCAIARSNEAKALGIGMGQTKTLAKLANHVAKTAERKPGSYPSQLAQVEIQADPDRCYGRDWSELPASSSYFGFS